MAEKQQARPVAFVARDYIVLADGTRYERGDRLPADVVKLCPPSFLEKGKK